MPPHLRTRQVVGIAIHAPHAAANFRIEREPIRGIQPFPRHALCGALPTRAAVFATEQTYVGIGQELAVSVKRIEMYAVHVSDVEPGADPLARRYFAGVRSPPTGAAVCGFHGPTKVSPVAKIRVLIGDSQFERIFCPAHPEAFSDPGVMDVRRWGTSLLPH